MRWRFPLLCALLVAGATAGVAQDRAITNQGFTWSIGFSKISLKIDCSLSCATQSTGALGFVGHAGWTLKNNLIAGVEFNLSQKAQDLNGDGDNEDVDFKYVGAALQFYPHAYREFFVKGAVGFGKSSTRMEVPTFGERDVDGSGLGFSLGTGIDFHVSKSFSITPYLDYLFGFKGAANLDGAASDVDLTTSAFQWGLKIVVH
jgi:outer membrane autotransporter protein